MINNIGVIKSTTIIVLITFICFLNHSCQSSFEKNANKGDQPANSEEYSISPFNDAVVVWHMSDSDLNTKETAKISVHGEVVLGSELGGPEKNASLQRGGDGKVADFNGGFLIAGNENLESLQLRGDKMTFCIRLRDTADSWHIPLFSKKNPDDALSKILYTAPLNKSVIGYPHIERIKDGRGIEFLWRTTPLADRVRPEYLNQGESPDLLRWHTEWEEKNIPKRRHGDFQNGLLRLNAPLDLVGKDRWHDIIIRFDREKLEMFVDGVLIDEEWPHGNLHEFAGPFLFGAAYQDGRLIKGFKGQIDHAALWNRSLSNNEILMLSGGQLETSRRDEEILGERQKPGQYWKPHGYNTSVGDCMAFSHNGTFHVFYLSVRRYGGSKWGLLATPWGHISTKDFITWEEHPCPLDITEPWECCLGTGSFVYHDGLYYMFYIKHDRRAWFKDNPNFGDAVFVATSKDCIHFEKQFNPLFVPGFFNENDINPDIYLNRTDSSYILSLSNWKVLESNDLQNWKVRDNLTTPPWWVCTSYFQWNNYYYFNSVGFYWMSDKPIEDPEAEWEWTPVQSINDGIRVPQMDWFNKRLISVGFTPSPPGTYYGGDLLFRELIQEQDGSLGSKWIEEMIPESGEALNLSSEVLTGEALNIDNQIQLMARDGISVSTLTDVPQNIRITLEVNPGPVIRQFGLGIRGHGDFDSACCLQFDPSRKLVWFAPLHDRNLASDKDNWMAINGVTMIDSVFTLDIIVKDDLVDVCIDKRRTIITRNKIKLNGDRIFFYADHGEVSFINIQVKPLLGK